jgi:hypothetical protein
MTAGTSLCTKGIMASFRAAVSGSTVTHTSSHTASTEASKVSLELRGRQGGTAGRRVSVEAGRRVQCLLLRRCQQLT